MRRLMVDLGALLLIVGTGCGVSEPEGSDGSALTECFEAEYAIEPTFDTAEDAVADALETEASLAAVPGSLDDYERVERSEDAVDLEFRESDDNYVAWSTAQDEDGRWGVVGASGCIPAGS